MGVSIHVPPTAFARARRKAPTGPRSGTKAGVSVMTAVELVADKALTYRFALERAKGIEPS
jgi:hypothetical protein